MRGKKLSQSSKPVQIHINILTTYDDALINNVQGIICGEFCGKCLHQCPVYTV
ncbi:MAG: hypothetical protein ACXABO_12860 [Promethearchaeota archaeon]|jgi:hypothetical protein